MKISTMTFTLGAVPDLYPIERFADIAAECGCQGINWVSTCRLTCQRVRELTAAAGLEVSSYTIPPNAFVHGGTHQEALDELHREIDTAAEIGAPSIMIVPLPIDGLNDRDASRKAWCEFLPELEPFALNAGIDLTIENYEGAASPFVKASELLEAKAAAPSLKFTFDIGNAALGEDPVLTAKQLAGSIAFCHFQDWNLLDSEEPNCIHGLDGRFYTKTLVGEGILDTPAVIRQLHADGYDGYIDIEYVGRQYTPADGVAKAAKYLKEQFALLK